MPLKTAQNGRTRHRLYWPEDADMVKSSRELKCRKRLLTGERVSSRHTSQTIGDRSPGRCSVSKDSGRREGWLQMEGTIEVASGSALLEC